MALPDAPDFPTAIVVPAAQNPDLVHLESSGPQSYHGGVYVLDQDVVITYQDRRVAADHIEYDSNTGDLTLTGHVVASGGKNNERISASHGTYNLKTLTGRFYDVSGSVGVSIRSAPGHAVYTNGDPFLFTGKVVVKKGPYQYDVYDGTVTSCALPKPDWLLTSDHFKIDETTARGYNSTFRLLNIPILFLPYVTHPTDPNERESGVLIPTVGESTTKGIILGEQLYLTLGRSADLVVGADYYSSIGFAQNATLRLRGPNIDFLTFHYTGVLDRRIGTANQGGEEFVLAGRHDLTPHLRAATNIDYLSSYIYREAFSDSFNQAVTSDIVSSAYVSYEQKGFEASGLADRYQGIKLIAQGTTPQQQVRIFHAPTFSFDTTDHLVNHTATSFSTGLEVDLNASASGLKRSDPVLVTSGIIERIDVHPQASYPIHLGDGAGAWHLLPTLGGRETFYSRSRLNGTAGQPPQESNASLSRSDLEFSLAVRPPVIARDFNVPASLQKIFGSQLRHTVAPELTYRLVDGVNNFSHLLRFDPIDVVSNTDEAEYGVTQRLYRKPRPSSRKPGAPCPTQQVADSPGFNSAFSTTTDPAIDIPEGDTTDPDVKDQPAPTGDCPSQEFISWRLTQKFFFDETFGAAIANGRRNIFATTLDLSGVAFLTENREISPLISRLRVRSSAHTDVEWDFDLDTGAKKFTSSNVFIDLHQGLSFAALSYARLDAPGRFYTENPTPTTGNTSTNGVNSSVSDFNQLRVLIGYGTPTKPGLSLAGNAGIDLKSLYGASSTSATGVSTTVFPALLQYAAVQGSYNWNCCGLAMEYRKFELGSTRNEGSYRFSFTLANIGAAGNLRRAERLF